MNLEKCAIVTSTVYNPQDEIDSVRMEIAEEALRNMSERVPLIAVDGGSPDKFLVKLKDYGVRVMTETKRGMGNARRKAIKAAYDLGAKAILWTEPEKDLSSFLPDLLNPIISGESKFVNARRKEIFSYPRVQQITETLGNELWKQVTGEPLDIFFGVRAWERELSEYFLRYDGQTQDSIHIPVIDLIYERINIREAVLDFRYPENQRRVEETSKKMTIKRFEQLANLSGQTVERWNFLRVCDSVV